MSGLHRLLTLAEDKTLELRRQLRPGDIAVFDNHRILQDRTELNMKNRRFLQWVQVERGDFHSTTRIQADRLQKPRDSNALLRGAYKAGIDALISGSRTSIMDGPLCARAAFTAAPSASIVGAWTVSQP